MIAFFPPFFYIRLTLKILNWEDFVSNKILLEIPEDLRRNSQTWIEFSKEFSQRIARNFYVKSHEAEQNFTRFRIIGISQK